jgi:hypothetical protein
MKKILFIIGIFYSVNSFAITEDTKMLVELIKSNQKINEAKFQAIDKRFEDVVELIKSNQKINEAKFQEMDKRFDLLERSTNAKIDALQKSTNAKIDALEKSTNIKIDATNAKIDALERSTNAKIDATNAKIDALEKSMNGKFDTMFYIMGFLFTATMTGFGIILRHLSSERKTIAKDIKNDIVENLEVKLNQKADISLVESIMNILEKFANKNADIAEVLSRHQLRPA